LGLECSARMLRRDPPMWSVIDLTLVPPHRSRLLRMCKYILSGQPATSGPQERVDTDLDHHMGEDPISEFS
jgi:hypothetical protein